MRRWLILCLFLLIAVAFLTEACQNQQDITFARYYTNGQALYAKHCQNCHNADGSGLGALIPPLTDTVFLRNNRDNLACIIKHGLEDTITVKGKTFNEKMPANHQLPEMDIAALVTYITNTFGNKQGLYDVAEVGKALQNCK